MIKTIGLFGCMVNNDNMGCCALTYSLINLIEQYRKKKDYSVKYIVFERNPDKYKISKLAVTLGIEEKQIMSEQSARFIRFYEWRTNRQCKHAIAKCDVIIDLTQGDSFTDIYGLNRFISYAMDKIMVERSRVPLILGPQTYGPFESSITKIIARRVIKNADYVMSRDALSKDYLKKLGFTKEVHVGTDLAIGLPYKNGEKKEKSVGVNISGLLWPDKIETGTEIRFNLKCDYREYMIKVVNMLLEEDYKVFFISHVGADYPACIEMNKIFPNTTIVEPFESPVDAKSFISGLELLIGARMHATIGAISSGVPVIPIAYSRKFKGFFENCGYNVGIDLTNVDLTEGIKKMKYYLENTSIIEENVLRGKKIAYMKYQKMSEELLNAIFEK